MKYHLLLVKPRKSAYDIIILSRAKIKLYSFCQEIIYRRIIYNINTTNYG